MKKSGSKTTLLFFVSMLSFFGMFVGLNAGVKAYAAENVVTTIASGFQSTDVVVDGSGHLYITDITNSRIVRMNVDGTNLTDFSDIVGRIAIDNVKGYIYIADGTVVTRMDTDGNNSITISGFITPVRGIAVDGSGQVYVGCAEGIVRMNGDGTDRVIINSTYKAVYSIAIDDVNGYIYAVNMTSSLSKRLVRMNLDGSNSISVTSGRLINDVAVDTNGLIYYTTGNSVMKRNSEGSEIIATGIGATGIAVDENGYIYVADNTTSTIKRIVSFEQFMAETKGYIVTNIDNENIAEIGNSLISKFDNFVASLDRENNTAAANQLNAFMNEISAQRGKKIAEDVATTLIAKAQTILEIIEVPVADEEAMTNEDTSIAEEEPTEITDPTVEKDSEAVETAPAEVPIVAEDPATLADPVVVEEPGDLETAPVEELEIDEEQAITEEATEENLPVGEENEVSTTEEMPTDTSTMSSDVTSVVEETQP